MNDQIFLLPKKKPLVCPICDITNLDKIRTCSCGTCKRCDELTSHNDQKYCGECSIHLESCCECGRTIKDGNFYYVCIMKIMNLKIKSEEYFMEKESDKVNIDKHIFNITDFRNKIDHADKQYRGKTRKEMIELLMDKH